MEKPPASSFSSQSCAEHKFLFLAASTKLSRIKSVALVRPDQSQPSDNTVKDCAPGHSPPPGEEASGSVLHLPLSRAMSVTAPPVLSPLLLMEPGFLMHVRSISSSRRAHIQRLPIGHCSCAPLHFLSARATGEG